MYKRHAFTMLELLFVIVIIGFLSKFGVEFLFQSYKSFIFSNVNNALQAQSGSAVELIAQRLQYRIKGSTIARENIATYVPLSEATGANYITLEWIGEDIDGFRGNSMPAWSGIFDFESPLTSQTLLVSPATNTNDIDQIIKMLAYEDGTTVNNAALYFHGCFNILGFGWNGTYNLNPSQPFTSTDSCMHPINQTATATHFIPNPLSVYTLAGKNIPEYYRLAWSAYAIVMENYNSGSYAGRSMGDLYLYYAYQPWLGESYTANGKKSLLAKNVSAFQYKAHGSSIKIQVCVKSDLVEDEEYALCKDKTIF